MNEKEILIRLFENSDSHEAAQIIKRNLFKVNIRDYDKKVIQKIAKDLTPRKLRHMKKQRIFFVASKGGHIVGTIMLQNSSISEVFVDPDLHNMHIGSSLMEHVESLALEKNIAQLNLHASLTAVGFYEKRGYKRVKKVDDPEYGTTWYMTKSLAF